MLIVDDKEFNKEFKDSGTPVKIPIPKPTATIVDVNKGRGLGNVAVPDSLRKVIGEESAVNGRQAGLEIAKNFGISPSSVSAYDNGAHSTASYNDTPNKDIINSAKERVSKRARTKLLKALNHLTDEKIGGAKANEISSIAKDMAVIMKHMEPDTPKGVSNVDNGPKFIFYCPQIRKEDVFDVTFAKE